MIKSFKHKGLEKFFKTGSKAGIQVKQAEKISLILSALDAAETIDEMNRPSFRLHSLQGSRKNIWSVWVNGNWRITFRFIGRDAEIVHYEDYH